MEHDAQIQRLKGPTGRRVCGSRVAALGLVCVLLRGASGIPAHADQIILTASKDNTLYETADGSTSNGAGTTMFAGRNSQATNSIRRALAWFDVSASVPAGSTIISAQLTMYNDASNEQDESVSLHRVAGDWGEGSSVASGGQGAAATSGDASWLHTFFNTQLWAQAGGDFQPIASGSTNVGATASYTWGSTAALVADVQSWLDSPTTNFGWCVVGSESAPSTAKRFATHEEADSARHPRLIVDYVPAGVPAISDWSAVTLALLLAIAGSLQILKRETTAPWAQVLKRER
jgi:hypothetical protein